MALTHKLEWDDNAPAEEVIGDIAAILDSGWSGFTKSRSWVQLVIDGVCRDTIFHNKPDEADINTHDMSGKWDAAFTILKRHVEAAAIEIKQLSLSPQESEQ